MGLTTITRALGGVTGIPHRTGPSHLSPTLDGYSYDDACRAVSDSVGQFGYDSVGQLATTTYGYRRLTAMLRRADHEVNDKRVASGSLVDAIRSGQPFIANVDRGHAVCQRSSGPDPLSVVGN